MKNPTIGNFYIYERSEFNGSACDNKFAVLLRRQLGKDAKQQLLFEAVVLGALRSDSPSKTAKKKLSLFPYNERILAIVSSDELTVVESKHLYNDIASHNRARKATSQVPAQEAERGND